MFKAPTRAKRRLHADIGPAARTVSEHLLACAVEDVSAWSGPVCLAPAARADAAWIGDRALLAGELVEQCDGNLGERIEFVNARLLERGYAQQIFIGSDCPGIDAAYLDAAERLLASHDVVLGPATDGGVVLMAIAGRWPAIAALPWSTGTLMTALEAACADAGLRVGLLEPRADVDAGADLDTLAVTLARDARPARLAFLRWLQSAAMATQ